VSKAESTCIAAGSNIRIRGDADGSWYESERLTFSESGTSASPIVVEGYGVTQPHIGGQYTLYTNSPSWTYNETDDTWYIGYSKGPVAAAYLLTSRPYEHERVGLVVYLDYGDLKADPNGLYVPGGDYYIGPGVHYNATEARLYIRLKRTPQVTQYEANYVSLGLGDSSDPNGYQILIANGVSGNDNYSVRTAGNYFTFRNLSIEPGFFTFNIACPGSPPTPPAKGIRLENNTIWSGNDGAIRSTCASEGITLVGNEIRADVPYWISWGDCKNEIGEKGPCFPDFGGWRFALIRPGNGESSTGRGWLIEHNIISGGHDGYVTMGGEGSDPNNNDPNTKMTIRYNVFEGFADDPFEIERRGVRRHDIHGNLIANSLNCLAVGQMTSDPNGYGPFYYHSNTCVLLREPYINRCKQADCSDVTTCDEEAADPNDRCQGDEGNGPREYGHFVAFKLHKPTDGAPSAGVHLYNNTIVMTDSYPSDGMKHLGDGAGDSMVGAQIFNNILIKMNQRVGQEAYHTDPNFVDYNLYWKMHNDSAALLDTHLTVAGLYGETGQEQYGLGDANSIGTNPVIRNLEGFGCFNQQIALPSGGGGSQCDGVVDRTATLWKIRAGSEYWSPAMFVPDPDANSPVCDVGRGSVPSGFPTGPAIEGIAFASNTIGAIPCGVSAANWNVFPFNAIWTTNELASGIAPVGEITSPTTSSTTIGHGESVNFCGSKYDTDGGPPFTYVWELTSGSQCPSIPGNLCPGSIAFPHPGTCVYSFKVTDRWGLQNSSPQQRTIVVQSGGGGGCQDCNRCICEQW